MTADPATSIGHIHNLAVDNQIRASAGGSRRGTGRTLIEASLEWMREKGMTIAKIDTLEVNSIGRWLYPSTGFDELVREINYSMPLEPRAPSTLPPNLTALEHIVERLTPEGATVQWWAEEVGVGCVSSANAHEAWPTASAIKAFLMAALFHEQRASWDSVPPELTKILDREPGFEAPLAMWDPARPEWEAYKVPEGTLETVIETLRNWTYRMIVQGMSVHSILLSSTLLLLRSLVFTLEIGSAVLHESLVVVLTGVDLLGWQDGDDFPGRDRQPGLQHLRQHRYPVRNPLAPATALKNLPKSPDKSRFRQAAWRSRGRDCEDPRAGPIGWAGRRPGGAVPADSTDG